MIVLTDLQKRKFTRSFYCLDADRDGYLEQSDFETILSNMAAVRGLRPGSPEYAALQEGVMSIWQNVLKQGDADGDGRCTLDEWLSMQVENLSNPERYRKYNVDNARLFFDLMDLDGDGQVGLNEWISFYHAFCRLPESVARESFARLDLNQDGILSREEIIELLRQFHYGNDPDAPGNWIFGRW